jgi:hypothetical protein
MAAWSAPGTPSGTGDVDTAYLNLELQVMTNNIGGDIAQDPENDLPLPHRQVCS